MSFTEVSFNIAICEKNPPIPLIILEHNGMQTIMMQDSTKCSQLFVTAAVICKLGYGQITEHVKTMISQLRPPEPIVINYAIKVAGLHAVIQGMHTEMDCNCSEIISEIFRLHEDIESHNAYCEFIDEVRQKFTDHEDFVCSLDLRINIIKAIPVVANYGDEYQNRVGQIKEVPNGFVAYEYWDNEDDILKISIKGYNAFHDFPAYDLCRAILEHGGMTREARESLLEGNHDAQMLFENKQWVRFRAFRAFPCVGYQ